MSIPKGSAAGGPPPSPEDRIVKHMNADHQDSLVRYLEYYCSVPSYTARHAHITGITLSSIQMSTSSSSIRPPSARVNSFGYKSALSADSYMIPLDPPLESWAQARERLVAMDKECVEKLGRDPITLKHYIFPRGYHLVLGILTITTLSCFWSRENLRPNHFSTQFRGLPIYLPAAFSFFHLIQPYVFYGMVLVHGFETFLIDRTRLRKHSVPRGSKIWWQWVLGAFFEGFGNFIRIDEYVKEEKAKRDKQKH